MADLTFTPIFELVEDQDEIYQSLGLFTSKEEAVREVEDGMGTVDYSPPSFDGAYGGLTLELRERKFGLSKDQYVVVWRKSFTAFYDEDIDDYLWRYETKNETTKTQICL